MAGSPTLVSSASLPRFIELECAGRNPGHYYLTLQVENGVPYLTFTAQQKTRLTAHEVLYNADEEGLVMLRAPNGQFWQRNSNGHVLADRQTIPSNPKSDAACYFKVFRHPDDGHLLFQSLVDDCYLKRYSSGTSHTLHASAKSWEDIEAAHTLTNAVDTAVVLPRYIMLKGDNEMYVGDHILKSAWLKFKNEKPVLGAAHEVIPLVDGNVVVLNINNQKYWRRSPNWIWADVATLSSASSNIECHFDVLKLSSTLVAFKSIANNCFLKRYTDSDWDDMLCAIGTTINDPTTHFLIKEASLSRSLFNIKYLLELAEVSDITPIMVGSGSMRNNTGFQTDLEVQVTLTQEVSKSQTWSSSMTFSSSLTVGFSVGVPEVSSVNGSVTVGQESTFSEEMGTTITNSLQFQSTFRVPGVPPNIEVRVTVECTTAKVRVPFTYSSKDTRIDGVDLPAVDNVNGIFEGVSAFNIRGVATEEGGDPNNPQFQSIVLPATSSSNA